MLIYVGLCVVSVYLLPLPYFSVNKDYLLAMRLPFNSGCSGDLNMELYIMQAPVASFQPNIGGSNILYSTTSPSSLL